MTTHEQAQRVKPVSPAEAKKLKERNIPDAVIKAFNEQIAKELTVNGRAVVKQCVVVEEICASGISKKDIYANNWLDVEDMYRAEGWQVIYDKPAYNETYEPAFIFKQEQ